MTFTVSINSNTRHVQDGSMTIALVANGRGTLSAEVYSADGSWRPALWEDITIVKDSTTIFGGLIKSCFETGAGGTPIEPIITAITAEDYNSLPSRRVVVADRPSETLEARLTWIVDTYLDDYGVTLDAAQATGPTLDAKSYGYVVLADVLNEISTLTGYVWEIDFDKELRMYLPSGSVPAPFNLTEGDHAVGDVTVEPSRDAYANRVYVKAGPDGTIIKTFTATGDGSEDTWTLDYPIVINPWPGYVTVNGNAETLGLSGDGGQWTLDPAAGTITRTSPVTNGHGISLTYTAQFPIWRMDEDATEISTYGLSEVVIAQPNIVDAAEAQAFATAELALRQVTRRTVGYQTYSDGLLPGQTQTITVADRGLSSTPCLITEVTITNDAGPTRLRSTVKAVASGFTGSWRDFWNAGASSRASTSTGSLQGAGSTVYTLGVSSWDGEAPPGQFYPGVGGFASAPSAISFNRFSSTNAWGLAVNSDAFGDFFGLVNAVLTEWAFKVYERVGAIWVCPPAGTSLNHYLGSPDGTSGTTQWTGVYADTLYGALEGSVNGLGDWADYTPSLVAAGGSPAIGSGGTLTGREMRVGNTGFFAFELTLGTSFSFGTGNVGITLPQTASANNRGAMDASATDTGVNGYPLIAKRASIGGAQVCGLFQWASPLAAITTTVPFTFASGDVISGAGWFEV